MLTCVHMQLYLICLKVCEHPLMLNGPSQHLGRNEGPICRIVFGFQRKIRCRINRVSLIYATCCYCVYRGIFPWHCWWPSRWLTDEEDLPVYLKNKNYFLQMIHHCLTLCPNRKLKTTMFLKFKKQFSIQRTAQSHLLRYSANKFRQ